MTRQASVFASLLLTSFTVTAAPTGDWPGWMGPTRDGVWHESGILGDFPATGLPVIWRTPVAGGFSGPAVAGGVVYLTDFVRHDGIITNQASSRDKVNGEERVLALDESSGQLLWQHTYPVVVDVSYGSGPRATPEFSDGKVYTLGTMGQLVSLDGASGAVLWQRNLPEDYKVKAPFWGFSAHLLVDRDLVISLVGGPNSTVVAFDKQSGEEKWRALSADEIGYCPPVIVARDDVRLLLIWHPQALNALDPASGEVYWSVPLPANHGMAVTQPQVLGSSMFVSGIGSIPTLFELNEPTTAPKISWTSTTGRPLLTGNSPPLLHEETIYGVDTRGYLSAVSVATGERLWSTLEATTGDRPRQYATAFLVRNRERFFIFNERGELILAELNQDGYREIGRTPILEPTLKTYGRQVVWSHPAFANRAIYARNDREVVKVSLAKTAKRAGTSGKNREESRGGRID